MLLKHKMTYIIRAGTTADAPRLQDVESAAGRLFLTVDMLEVASNDPTALKHFESRARKNQLLVVVEQESDRPVGFLYWAPVDGAAYIEELAVDPQHAGNRLGARLLDALADKTSDALTLATFRDVPWNAPYYSRLGFSERDCALLGPGHEREWQKQAKAGLDMTRRLFMRREPCLVRPSV